MAATVVASSMRRILLVLLGVKTMGWAWLWHGGPLWGTQAFYITRAPGKTHRNKHWKNVAGSLADSPVVHLHDE